MRLYHLAIIKETPTNFPQKHITKEHRPKNELTERGYYENRKVYDIYPLTIICDRYSGTYSGGEYLAFNLDFDEIPQEVLGDDTTAICYKFNIC